MGVDIGRLLLALPYANATEQVARNDQQQRNDTMLSELQDRALNRRIVQQRLLEMGQEAPLHTRLLQSEMDRNTRDASLADPHDTSVNPQDAAAYRARYPELQGLSDEEAVREGQYRDRQGVMGTRQQGVRSTVPGGRRAPSSGGRIPPAAQQLNREIGQAQGNVRLDMQGLPPMARAGMPRSAADSSALDRLGRDRGTLDSLQGVQRRQGATSSPATTGAAAAPTGAGVAAGPADLYETLRNRGLSHDDAVRMVRQRFPNAVPNQQPAGVP